MPMGAVSAFMGSILVQTGSVLSVEGKCFGLDGKRSAAEGKCFRPEGKRLALMGSVSAWKGNVWPPGEVSGLLKGSVPAPDAFLCEMRRVSGFAWPSKLC